MCHRHKCTWCIEVKMNETQGYCSNIMCSVCYKFILSCVWDRFLIHRIEYMLINDEAVVVGGGVVLLCARYMAPCRCELNIRFPLCICGDGCCALFFFQSFLQRKCVMFCVVSLWSRTHNTMRKTKLPSFSDGYFHSLSNLFFSQYDAKH